MARLPQLGTADQTQAQAEDQASYSVPAAAQPKRKKARSRKAPLPAFPTTAAPVGNPAVPAPAGMAMLGSIGQMAGLNRLRDLRLKTSGL